MKCSAFVLRILCLLLFVLASVSSAADLPEESAGKIDPATWLKVEAGEVRDLLVLFDEPAIDVDVRSNMAGRRRQVEDSVALSLRAVRYRQLKDRVLGSMAANEAEVRKDYRHIPMSFVRIRDSDALAALLERQGVLAVYEDVKLYPTLAQSLPLLGQPQVEQVMGRTGEGAVVAVLDSGVDYTRAEFGSCAAPGAAGCRVVFARDFAPEDGQRDANGHGTWVAGTVAGIAPGAGIAALDVFDGNGALSSDITEAIDWAIANKATYNIVAINMSLGDGVKHTSPCSIMTGASGNPFRQAIINARNAGILTVVSSGNEGFTDGLASPACTPEAVSVGAVYDANVGAITWSGCTDSTSAADKVTCFSDSASFLTLLAPGALITVTGSTVGGTSFASPFVAGAVAVMAEAYPGDSVANRLARLTSSGKLVTDSRNGIVKPRLDLLAAQGAPANDDFAASRSLSGSSGQVTSWNLNADKETGEPSHAGNSGGKSVWWQWTAPTAGTLSLNTHGSGFDTLLAVYSGTTLSALSAVASNDNDGASGSVSGVNLSVQSGTTYRIAVDGKAGASGAITLNWSLKMEQGIVFNAIAGQPLNSIITLVATASSGLPVSFSSMTPGVCTVSGSRATMTATGLCSIAADQPGNASFLPATRVIQGFNVFPIIQGVCGSANGQALSTVPVAGLCSTGTPSLVSGTGPWTWTCYGSGGGSNAACSASLLTNPNDPGSDNGDVPLPLWSLVLLGAGLFEALRRRGSGR